MSFVKTRLKNVYEDPSSGIYYVRIRRKGKRPFNKSLDTKNFKIAAIIADEMIREYLGHAPKRPTHRLFKDEVDDFKKAYVARVRASTFKRTETVIKHHLMPYWENKIISSITPGEWDKYLASEQAKGDRDLSNDKKAMGNILTFAYEEKRIDAVPRLTDPSEKSDIGKAYSDDELKALLRAAQDEDIRLAILLSYKSGPRIGEIVSIAWKGINYAEKSLKVKGKTGLRTIAIGDVLVERLKARRKKSQSEWVFPKSRDPKNHISTNQFDNAWQPIKKSAGVDGRFHDLRHTFITRALVAGKSIFWVSKQVGSSVRTITKVYEHLDMKDISELGETVSIADEKEILSVDLV